MKRSTRILRALTMLTTGAVMVQFTGCDATGFFDVIQTILLGVTAAGSVAILRNV